MCFVYIIYSRVADKFYIGQTSDIAKRLADHNVGIYNDAFTKRASDWKLFFSIKCDSIKQAILIEKHIKRMKSRKYIENLLQFPEIAEKLKRTYS
jgi:putative endonuclease